MFRTGDKGKKGKRAWGLANHHSCKGYSASSLMPTSDVEPITPTEPSPPEEPMRPDGPTADELTQTTPEEDPVPNASPTQPQTWGLTHPKPMPIMAAPPPLTPDRAPQLIPPHQSCLLPPRSTRSGTTHRTHNSSLQL